MSATFTLALSVLDGDALEDVLVRGNAEQTVGELAQRLAAYLGRSTGSYGLRVERTGEQLRPDSPLSSVDLLEGDTVALLAPRGSSEPRRRPRWADDDSSGTVVRLRPRRPSDV